MENSTLPVNDNSEPINIEANNSEVVSFNFSKIAEIIWYCIGVIFLIVSFTYLFNDLDLKSSGDIYDFHEKEYVGGDAYNYIISAARSSAIMTKSLIYVVMGCSSIIAGRLTAIANKK